MDKGHNLRVAVVGAGPRGISVLERLIARREALAADRRPNLEIHLIDPEQPGPGQVWRADQSRLFLMNTPSLFPTVVPVGASALNLAPSVVGLSFDDWRVQMAAEPAVVLCEGDRAELARLDAAGFPSRVLYGRYLAWVYERLVERCGDGADVVHHATDARRIRPGSGGYRIKLGDGSELMADAVVLALGHLPARLSPEQEILRNGAARFSLQYWPPAVPADIDWNRLPAKKAVLIRGLGLNFFDVMIALTEGRGGQFRPDGAGLVYTPSGREPQIVAASRRGVPYRAKAQLDTYIPRSVSLRYCTLEALRSFPAQGVQPGFDHDIWPLLHRDVLRTYYRTMARVDPDRLLAAPEAFLAGLEQALDADGQEWAARLSTVLEAAVPTELRLDVESLAHPFAGRRFADAAEYQNAVLAYLDEDAAGSALGEDSPLKMAIGAMNAGRTVIKQTVSDGGLTDSSWMAELRGWFEPLVEGLASGPPAVRIAQLAALARAGLVQFVGPNSRFTVDADSGRFAASSPWVQKTVFAASYLVDAMMPANLVLASLSPLLRQLFDDEVVRPKVMMAEDGVPVSSAGLDVTQPPYRAVGGSGQPQRELYVIGLQLASVQWGTAIAAEAGGGPDAGARTLRDADDIAGAILAGPEHTGNPTVTAP